MGEALKKTPQLVTLDRAMKDLPPLPAAVVQVLKLAGDKNSRAAEMERYIITDQAISTKVLRVVNSPYFGLASQVSSISQAIVILGFDQIRNLVLSLSTSGLFKSTNEDIQKVHLELWRHAIATAAAAQLIAKRKRVDPKDQDLIFSGGLLTNVGALFLSAQFAKPYLKTWSKYWEGEAQLAELESTAFGMDHAEVGKQLSVAWRFPETLALLVGRHEGPFDGDPIPSLYSVHAADRIGATVCKGSNELVGVDPAVMEWLQFADDEIEVIFEETANRLAAASDLLGVFG